MAVTATITLDVGTECFNSLQVFYKRDFETTYKRMDPDPTETPFQIQNLDPGTTYNVSVQKLCCNGQISIPLTFDMEVPETP